LGFCCCSDCFCNCVFLASCGNQVEVIREEVLILLGLFIECGRLFLSSMGGKS
jgi:hypothetical protein